MQNADTLVPTDFECMATLKRYFEIKVCILFENVALGKTPAKRVKLHASTKHIGYERTSISEEVEPRSNFSMLACMNGCVNFAQARVKIFSITRAMKHLIYILEEQESVVPHMLSLRFIDY